MRIVFLLFCFTILLFGDHLHNHDDYNEEKASLLEQSLHEGAEFRGYLSERFTAFTTTIDNFLADEPDEKTYENKSFAHLQYSFEKIESESVSSKLDLKVRIRLPKTKGKYRIELENVDTTNDKSKDARIGDVNKDNDYSVGVSRARQLKEYLNFKTKVGVKVKIDEFDPFIMARIRRTFNESGDWKSDAAQKVYLFEERGFESTTSYEIYNIFSEKLKFSNYNEYFWREKVRDDNFYNSLRLYQNVSKRDYLSYVTGVTTNNEDSNLQAKSVQAYISYRHYFKQWLYYDLIPKVQWLREDNFETKYGFRLNMGMFFGKKKNY